VKVAIEDLQPLKERFALENNISWTNYLFYFQGKIKNQAYSKSGTDTNIEKTRQ
jgi:hypothetical protein